MQQQLYPEGPDHESYFDRHECIDYTPKSYPDWTEKQWKALWHSHKKCLNDKVRSTRLEKEHKIIQLSILTRTIQIISERKADESHKRFVEQKKRMENLSHIRTGNTARALHHFRENCDTILGYEDGCLIYLLYNFNWQEKQKLSKLQRQALAIIKKPFVDILIQRGLPIAGDELRILYEKIPQNKLKEYYRAMGH